MPRENPPALLAQMSSFVELQRQRLKFAELGPQLERFAPRIAPTAANERFSGRRRSVSRRGRFRQRVARAGKYPARVSRRRCSETVPPTASREAATATRAVCVCLEFVWRTGCRFRREKWRRRAGGCGGSRARAFAASNLGQRRTPDSSDSISRRLRRGSTPPFLTLLAINR